MTTKANARATKSDSLQQASDAYFNRRITAKQYNAIRRGTLTLNEAIRGSQSGGGPLGEFPIGGGGGDGIDSGDLLTRGATSDRRPGGGGGIDSGDLLTGGAGNDRRAPQPEGFQDPHTGAITDVDAYLRALSGEGAGRRNLFTENLLGSPSFMSSPRSVQNFLRSRFDPLEAQYLGESIADPTGAGENFGDFLGENQRSLTGDQWLDLWGGIGQNFGGVNSAEDAAGLGRIPGIGGPLEAGYENLKTQGKDIFGEVIGSNVHPALARAVGDVLDQRWAQWSGPSQGSPSNQWAFLQEQSPMWSSILNPQGERGGGFLEGVERPAGPELTDRPPGTGATRPTGPPTEIGSAAIFEPVDSRPPFVRPAGPELTDRPQPYVPPTDVGNPVRTKPYVPPTDVGNPVRTKPYVPPTDVGNPVRTKPYVPPTDVGNPVRTKPYVPPTDVGNPVRTKPYVPPTDVGNPVRTKPYVPPTDVGNPVRTKPYVPPTDVGNPVRTKPYVPPRSTGPRKPMFDTTIPALRPEDIPLPIPPRRNVRPSLPWDLPPPRPPTQFGTAPIFGW